MQKFIQLALLNTDSNQWSKIAARSGKLPSLDTALHLAQGVNLSGLDDFRYDPNGQHFGVPKGVSLQHAITRLKSVDPESYKDFLSGLDQGQIVRKAFDRNPVDTGTAGDITLADVLHELGIDL